VIVGQELGEVENDVRGWRYARHLYLEDLGHFGGLYDY
jgi:hypothetical protein